MKLTLGRFDQNATITWVSRELESWAIQLARKGGTEEAE
jgi:hypothetical protein